jgi:ribosomal protein S18 acetylase RimI-like enzyme
LEILEYDQVDPVDVLDLNLLSLGYPLTPERAALIRALDERPFPFFALYAVEDGIIAGQVGVYRLPVMTTDGPQEVGGAWAVCTHPAFERRGIAYRLMDDAHQRMQEAGLRFSTLGTARHRGAYALYKRLGYEDVFIPTSSFARLEDIRQETALVAERASPEQIALAEAFYQQAAVGYLGFARRGRNYLAIMAATGDLDAGEVWLLWDGDRLAGYALASLSESILAVNSLLLEKGQGAAEAVAAICKGQDVRFVRVRVDHPSVGVGLLQGGYPSGLESWTTFMVKPLATGASAGEARRLLGIGTPRFLISYIDVT